MADNEYLIHENPLKALIVFSTPMIIGNLFQQFYTMVDSMVVGRYVSESALAAVGAAYALTNVFICIAIGGGVGASVVVSRYFGARRYDKMKQAAYTALFSFLIMSISLGIFGITANHAILRILNTPEDIMEMTAEYLSIYFLGLPFLFLYNILSSMFHALGHSKPPLYLLIFSSILNIFLDVYMVRSLHMGVPGVAWATLIAQGISAVISFLLYFKLLSTFQSEKMPFFHRQELIKMSKVAFPSIFQQSTVSIGMMLVQSVVNSFGTQMLAGFSAAMRVESICNVPMTALGNAASSYTSQNIGAGRKDRVLPGYHKCLGIVAIFAVIICLSLELFHNHIIAAFLGNEQTELALETGVGYLKFMGWFFILIGSKMVTDGVLRGAGDMKMFTVANFVNLSIRVSFAVILAPRFGIAMVWYAVPIGWAANFLISHAELRTGKWMQL